MTASASLQSGYLLNASFGARNFLEWAAAESGHSPRFQAQIDRLRALAAGGKRHGYSRSTGPLHTHTWPEITALRGELTSQPQQSRPRAWKSTPLPTDESYRHVREYQRAVLKTARDYLGPESAAPLIHDLVAATGYTLPSFQALAPVAPTGKTASSLAAHITGASWGKGATAARIAWRRARPHTTFIL